jgi:hypothetical protein
MKKVLVLTSVNNNRAYVSALDGAARSWAALSNSKVSFDFLVIHVKKSHSKAINPKFAQVREVLLPEGIDDIFASQMARLLFADQFAYDGVILTDADLLPTNPEYFIDPILNDNGSNFVVFRNVLQSENQYPICFLYASPKIWAQLLGTEDPMYRLKLHWESIPKFSYSSVRGSITWTYDQRWIYARINSSAESKSILSFPYPHDIPHLRLDRIHRISYFPFIAIYIRKYTDYHRKIPIRKIDKITEFLLIKKLAREAHRLYD